MSHIELAPGLADDFDRILERLSQYEVPDAPVRVEQILQGISVLEHNPLVGRAARNDTRELILGRRSRGYVALYRYVEEIDSVFILAIRSQKEAGYKSL